MQYLKVMEIFMLGIQYAKCYCYIFHKKLFTNLVTFFFSLNKDSDNGDVNYDYDHELSLEMKRQKIQRELMKLEQENMEKREEIVIKKEVCIM